MNSSFDGRAFSYRPLLSREQAARNQIQDLLAHSFDGKSERMIDAIRSLERNETDLPAGKIEQAMPHEKHQSA